MRTPQSTKSLLSKLQGQLSRPKYTHTYSHTHMHPDRHLQRHAHIQRHLLSSFNVKVGSRRCLWPSLVKPSGHLDKKKRKSEYYVHTVNYGYLIAHLACCMKDSIQRTRAERLVETGRLAKGTSTCAQDACCHRKLYTCCPLCFSCVVSFPDYHRRMESSLASEWRLCVRMRERAAAPINADQRYRWISTTHCLGRAVRTAGATPQSCSRTQGKIRRSPTWLGSMLASRARRFFTGGSGRGEYFSLSSPRPLPPVKNRLAREARSMYSKRR